MILTILLLYIIIKFSKQVNLQPIIIRLITQAEKEFGSGEGAKKFNYVVDELYDNFMPKIMKLFFSEEEVKQFIQSVFDMIKDALHYTEEGVSNGK